MLRDLDIACDDQKGIIPDAGHFVHQEKPEEVSKTLLAFLNS